MAEFHPLFRGALREALAGLDPRSALLEAASCEELQALVEPDSAIDRVLLVLAMPEVRGLSRLVYLRGQYPFVPVVVVSVNEEPTVIRHCFDFGASGFTSKTADAEAMRVALRAVLNKEAWTPPDITLAASDDDTRGLAHRRAAIGGDEDGRQVAAEPPAQKQDGVEAVPPIEVEIDEEHVRPGAPASEGGEISREERPTPSRRHSRSPRLATSNRKPI